MNRPVLQKEMLLHFYDMSRNSECRQPKKAHYYHQGYLYCLELVIRCLKSLRGSGSPSQVGVLLRGLRMVLLPALATDPALFTFTPVPWYRSSVWLNPSILGALVVIFLSFLAWPVCAFARWRFNVPFPYQGTRENGFIGLRQSQPY